MNALSSSSSSNFTFFTQSKNPSHHFKFTPKVPNLPLHSSPSHLTAPAPCCSLGDSSTTLLEKNALSSELSSRNAVLPKDSSFEEALVVRRPMTDFSGEDSDEEVEERCETENNDPKGSSIVAGLAKVAKKMPMFEPKRVESKERPLAVNLDLAIYRANVLARKFRYEEAEAILQKCISYWPEDGRPYVVLGKILSKQSKTGQAREIYETGCQAMQGENAYIWQCWAVLEMKVGNIRRAKQLFDAATVADKKHVAAWHGWAVLELKQGNIQKARNLLAKGLQYCGQNEYIYQTLALLEAKANRYQQARYLFSQATRCNPNSCASWLAWAQMEMEQENYRAARKLFEKAVQASPKNRFAWHVWGVFEANMGNVDKGRKLLKIGHALNPRDAVLLQSLALLEYEHSTANLARILFRRASELDPRHQPVWFAWGWMEWKEGNLNTARELYQKTLSIDLNSETAARCLQAWGVLEQRVGNLSAARRLFKSSLNINSQSYVTWMTWASLEEDQGNSVRAEEIRNLYFQQRTEVVDDASWVTGFLDILDPAIDSLKRLLKLDPNSYSKPLDSLISIARTNKNRVDFSSDNNGDDEDGESGFDLDAFIKERLSIDLSNLEFQLDTPKVSSMKKSTSTRRIWRSNNRIAKV
ncbi:protein high chlorophyll fluorescent 107 isoform X1 [Abrus precatorius]|uniref:Protein high chlorophyll fluorescent 107 isoform X1 n=1 Tax=Abrus precatorius TaxID=3816 RepID=A0A8B8JJ04_ABRPR|nr:protein high chlorophyll fluorescent 107 isoform X1 [Abrus precatorius]